MSVEVMSVREITVGVMRRLQIFNHPSEQPHYECRIEPSPVTKSLSSALHHWVISTIYMQILTMYILGIHHREHICTYVSSSSSSVEWPPSSD
jgi:hypothetical protein